MGCVGVRGKWRKGGGGVKVERTVVACVHFCCRLLLTECECAVVRS